MRAGVHHQNHVHEVLFIFGLLDRARIFVAEDGEIVRFQIGEGRAELVHYGDSQPRSSEEKAQKQITTHSGGSLCDMRFAKQAIRRRLLAWYDANRRDLPWRRTNDPYRILVSEVMLQQTRVAAVLPYYERFIKLFPTALTLARARDSSVLRAWAGLGYYSRARRLQAAAKEIASRGFPSRYDDVLALPGIGPYTAAAVMSNP